MTSSEAVGRRRPHVAIAAPSSWLRSTGPSGVRSVRPRSFRRHVLVLSADPRPPPDSYIGDVSHGLVTTLLAEPAVADPPRRVWRDWVLVGLITFGTLLEGIFRENLVWGPWPMFAVVLLGFTLLWRRQHPLAMTAVSMGAFIVLDQLARLIEGRPVEAYTSAFLLIHVYALFRWASGRDCARGLGVMGLAFASSLLTSWTGVVDAIAGGIVLLFPAVLGAEVRHLVQRRERTRDEVKAREREFLARELHDTVAHHVSAIAVQAQAGRAIGAHDPRAALDVLAVIESEASRTLAEMRSMVGTLRRRDGIPPSSGQYALADIEDLATSHTAAGVPVDIERRGDLDDLPPMLQTALYRVAQESITNARRHARRATRVDVLLTRDSDGARVSVTDDGERGPMIARSTGYGLVGMAERVSLLGGTFEAGPTPDRGWAVHARVPLPPGQA